MIALFFGVLSLVLFIGREEFSEILAFFWRAGK